MCAILFTFSFRTKIIPSSNTIHLFLARSCVLFLFCCHLQIVSDLIYCIEENELKKPTNDYFLFYFCPERKERASSDWFALPQVDLVDVGIRSEKESKFILFLCVEIFRCRKHWKLALSLKDTRTEFRKPYQSMDCIRYSFDIWFWRTRYRVGVKQVCSPFHLFEQKVHRQ